MSNYVRLYPWTLKHAAVLELTPRARLAYIELLADVATHPQDHVTEKWLHRLIRKDHREALLAAGLIVRNTDGTYTVVQPSGMYAPLRTPETAAG
ncbi:hypothetical protein SEA_CLOWN_73 [Gordonia phage Clown]|uniref:Uncharacterized protein n=1 Tax=Gordonia phage Clown TaxID=2759393 RepID=A0A7L7SIJ2_9CAUD|nr:hypothetical protein KNV25_gp73 [Gordonia phage Clown]QOC56071.1 hypothetical protein SEA_CLOWN_73 [Gordonia phage Clown]